MEENLRLAEEIMGLDEGELKPDMKLEDIEEWDSLASLALMAEVKRKSGRRLTAAEVRGFKTVKDVCDSLAGGEQ